MQTINKTTNQYFVVYFGLHKWINKNHLFDFSWREIWKNMTIWQTNWENRKGLLNNETVISTKRWKDCNRKSILWVQYYIWYLLLGWLYSTAVTKNSLWNLALYSFCNISLLSADIEFEGIRRTDDSVEIWNSNIGAEKQQFECNNWPLERKGNTVLYYLEVYGISYVGGKPGISWGPPMRETEKKTAWKCVKWHIFNLVCALFRATAYFPCSKWLKDISLWFLFEVDGISFFWFSDQDWTWTLGRWER